MKHFRTFCLLLITILAAVHSALATSDQKNVLFLIVDDLRPNLGCYSDTKTGFDSPPMHTPNIDSLAARSLLLERSYAQWPQCNPTRASALTGRRPDTTHVYDMVSNFREVGGDFTTIPQFFKEQGYQTDGYGKLYFQLTEVYKSYIVYIFRIQSAPRGKPFCRHFLLNVSEVLGWPNPALFL